MTTKLTDHEMKQVALTVAEHLTHRTGVYAYVSLATLLGVKNDFVALDGRGGLQFSFRGNSRMNKVVIRLNENDYYDIEFWQVKTGREFKCEQVSLMTDIGAENLRAYFERETGLRTRL
jgi:hypothetical protein